MTRSIAVTCPHCKGAMTLVQDPKRHKRWSIRVAVKAEAHVSTPPPEAEPIDHDVEGREG